MSKVDLVSAYTGSRAAHQRFAEEMARRAEGLSHAFTRDFFFHMNPLYEPARALEYVVGRYEAAYDALRDLRPKSVLEIGCAQGLSAWLMSSWADDVVGLDISEARCAIGSHVFPEIEVVCADWRDYLEGSGRTFDVIVSSHGPFIWDDAIPRFCKNYINIGYRASRWSDALTGRHKIKGTQLSFSTTLWQGDASKFPDVRTSYSKYFFRRNWLKEARHSLSHGYALPI